MKPPRKRESMSVEGVRYFPYRVRFALLDGTRKRWIRWSPGYPFVRSEVARELAERFGTGQIRPGSTTTTLDI